MNKQRRAGFRACTGRPIALLETLGQGIQVVCSSSIAIIVESRLDQSSPVLGHCNAAGSLHRRCVHHCTSTCSSLVESFYDERSSYYQSQLDRTTIRLLRDFDEHFDSDQKFNLTEKDELSATLVDIVIDFGIL